MKNQEREKENKRHSEKMMSKHREEVTGCFSLCQQEHRPIVAWGGGLINGQGCRPPLQGSYVQEEIPQNS